MSRETDMRRKITAFTLVELLIVIGIISLLIGVLLPALSRARGHANQLACLSNLRQLDLAYLLYCQDNCGWFPRAAPYATAAQPESPQDFLWWQQDTSTPILAPNRDVFNSPIMKYLGFGGDKKPTPTVIDFSEKRQQVLRCPSDYVAQRLSVTANGKYYYSYSVNNLMQSFDPSIHIDALAVPINSVTGKPFQPAEKLCKVHNPDIKVLIVEESEATLNDGSFDPTESTTGAISGLLSVRHDPAAQLPEMNVTFTKISGNTWTIRNANCRGNVAFCDGHADYVCRSFVNDPTSQVTGTFPAWEPLH
ncbi:MAG TPA: type II secretion system protein [Tepidisphaeraceae bacterium]|jgi:prepilin-type processing-associated H-X9-DG protein